MDETFRRGLADHQAGRLPQAEAAYREILATAPRHADALHGLGVIAHQVGRNDMAAQLIGEAVGVSDERADFHCNLGLVYNQLGRNGEAEACLRIALRLKPDYPDALNNLGIALAALGRTVEAEASYQRALRLKPRFADALNNLGLAQARLGRPREAEASYRAALVIDPRMADAHGNLGLVQASQGQAEAAESSYRQALRLRPDYPDALNNLGVLLSDLGRAAEAEICLRRSLNLAADKVDALSNLGAVLTKLGRAEEAETSVREALRLAPADADAHFNLGAALHEQWRTGEAEASYRKALGLRRDFADAHVNLAYALLLAGRMEEGWREHEWRWRGKHLKAGARDFSVPQWRGEALDGRTLLLHAEQGLGDTLQFCRYAALIKGAARIILEVQPPLKRLMTSLPCAVDVIARREALPAFDVQCPLLSLPLAFGTRLETIPAAPPYLAAEPAAVERWRGRLGALCGPRVGLVWAGGARPDQMELAAVDGRRSMALAVMAPLAQVTGVSFVSLQVGPPATQAASPPAGLSLIDVSTELSDFADTAALVEALDLVISVDTSVAHLAGALGKPVWLLNRFDTCWRWLQGRNDSPWYPTLRQFRQEAPGDWAGVMERVLAALHAFADEAAASR